uniref:Uncharacterized protein n=1 Tax=Nelumbo nucifera TaxID=4432 RepID=A0A822XZU8_NELNU|nr:TPA_asm: hypothetical protein HUJ06_024381 [Nelumbo nucifera]
MIRSTSDVRDLVPSFLPRVSDDPHSLLEEGLQLLRSRLQLFLEIRHYCPSSQERSKLG